MKNKRMNVLGVVAVSAIAIGALGFTGGCKSQEPEKNYPTIPPPSSQPVSAQPALPPTPAAKPPAANIASPAPAIHNAKAKAVKYTVVKGDSFSKIAKKFGVGMKPLASYNNMSLQKPLQVGKVLMIPPKAAK